MSFPSARVSGKWVLRTLFLLVVLGLVVALSVYLWGRKRQGDVEAVLKARGESLAMEDFIPSPIPDAENFYADPAWLELADVVTKEDGLTVEPRIAKGERRLDKLDPPLTAAEIAALKAEWPEFEWKDSSSRTSQLAKAWAAAKKDGSPEALRRVAEFTLAVLRPAVPLFAKLEEWGARPGEQFSRKSEADRFNTFDASTYLLTQAQVVLYKARAEITLGQSAAAQKDVLLLFRLAKVANENGMLIGFLVRNSVLSMAVSGIKTGLELHAWSDAELDGFQRKLEGFSLIKELAEAMRAERAFSAEAMADTMERYKTQSGVNPFERMTAQGRMAIIAPYDRADHFEKLQAWIEELEAQDGLPTASARLTERETAHGDAPRIGLMAFSFPLARTSLLEIEAGAIKTQDLLIQCRIACALEQYWLKNGSYPPVLAALTPDYLPGVPKDVVDNQPMKYRLESPQEYNLYSVGFNRIDDGGKTVPKKKREGDWVWGAEGS